MKKILLSTIAFSIIATPAAFAQPYKYPYKKEQRANGLEYNEKYRRYQSTKKHRWTKGQRFDRDYRRYRVHERDYGRYHLRRPPRGYDWVRVDNEFLLVATATGIISSIIGAAITSH